MTTTVLLISATIAFARIVDVSLGTLRTIYVVRGRKLTAAGLGFVEVLIWIVVVSRVVQNLDEPWYAVSYALGFALGTWVGMTLERQLTGPAQVIRIFSRRSAELSRLLREQEFTVTEFEGRGREGPIGMLFLETTRKRASDALRAASQGDADCYCIVDDITLSGSGARIQTGTRTLQWPMRPGK